MTAIPATDPFAAMRAKLHAAEQSAAEQLKIALQNRDTDVRGIAVLIAGAEGEKCRHSGDTTTDDGFSQVFMASMGMVIQINDATPVYFAAMPQKFVDVLAGNIIGRVTPSNVNLNLSDEEKQHVDRLVGALSQKQIQQILSTLRNLYDSGRYIERVARHVTNQDEARATADIWAVAAAKLATAIVISAKKQSAKIHQNSERQRTGMAKDRLVKRVHRHWDVVGLRWIGNAIARKYVR